uniref:Uncharacterized protein n=1 Tax=Aegilops tauschii subsp. strangulata TaxID=200361 RepID=A0A453G0B6_AEGTS
MRSPRLTCSRWCSRLARSPSSSCCGPRTRCALVQMEDLSASISAIQYYTTIQPSVRGRNVYLQYSSHQELTTDQSSHGRNPDQVHNYPVALWVLYSISMIAFL